MIEEEAPCVISSRHRQTDRNTVQLVLAVSLELAVNGNSFLIIKFYKKSTESSDLVSFRTIRGDSHWGLGFESAKRLIFVARDIADLGIVMSHP